MKKINLSEEKIYAIIAKVAKNHRNKNFEIYSSLDIEQEVWVIALKVIDEFDGTKSKHKDLAKGFEHWLNKVIANRLNNLHRDKYLIKKRNKNKEVIGTVSIHSIAEIDQMIDTNYDNIDFWDAINKHLTPEDLDILDSVLSNESINSYYKIKLRNKLRMCCKDIYDI
jgi:hypothetical protein